MKSLILACVICLELTVVAFAWTHGAGISGFILDNSSVILTDNGGGNNILAQ